MQGSIRVFIGFMIVFGAVGTLDFDPTASVWLQGALAIVGLGLMASGVKSMNRKG